MLVSPSGPNLRNDNVWCSAQVTDDCDTMLFVSSEVSVSVSFIYAFSEPCNEMRLMTIRWNGTSRFIFLIGI